MNSNEYQTTFGELIVGALFTRDGWKSVDEKIRPYFTTGGSANYRMLKNGHTGWCEDGILVRTAPRDTALAKQFASETMFEADTWEGAAQVVADDIVKLIAKKQHDYGHGNILGFGEMGVAVRVWDKVNRLKTLLVDRKGQDSTGEAVEDTWTDLAGYAIIALMLRKGWFKLPLKEDKDVSTNKPTERTADQGRGEPGVPQGKS